MWKNPEIKRITIEYVLTSLVVAAVLGLWYGVFAFTVFSAFVIGVGLCFFLYERRKYREMEQLSDMISRVLHGDDTIDFSKCSEGELAILYSEIHKMTIRLREQSENLERDKAELSDAIADISHQLRTPLTSINVDLSLLVKDEQDEGWLSTLYDMRKSIGRIDWLIEALLKLSKLDAKTAKIERTEINLKEIVEEAVEPFLISMDLRDISLETSYMDGEVCLDRYWTREALGNLLKNAIEHTEAGGRIRIETRDNPIFSEIIIEDSGEGFANEDIPHLFERFYKGQNASKESVGIGLALARSVIASEDGTIKASNVIDRTSGNVIGARFEVRFYKEIV